MKINLPKKIYGELRTILGLVYMSVGKEYFEKNFPTIFNWFADDFQEIDKNGE